MKQELPGLEALSEQISKKLELDVSIHLEKKEEKKKSQVVYLKVSGIYENSIENVESALKTYTKTLASISGNLDDPESGNYDPSLIQKLIV